jgi:hypothetical protein
MNYETLYHGWSFVNAIACKAENQIYQAIETCRKGEGPPPTVEELAEARKLRQIASDYLDKAMTEIWRNPL